MKKEKEIFDYRKYFTDIYNTVIRSPAVMTMFIAEIISLNIISHSKAPFWVWIIIVMISWIGLEMNVKIKTNWYKEYKRENYYIKDREIKLEIPKGQWDK